MSLLMRSRNILGKSILVLAVALLPISVFAGEEHKAPAQHGGGGSHPQSHAAPSHALGQSHAAPSHAGGESHAGGQSHAAGQSHPSGMSHETMGGQHGAAVGHPAGTSHAGSAQGTHGGNMGAGHAGGNMGGRAGTAGGNRAGSMAAGRGAPGRRVALSGGGSASIRPNGQIRSINRNGMHIQNNLHGGRTVVSEHNGTRIVGTGHGNGYVQHAYMTRGGHSYYSRTYFSNGVYHTGLYRGYFYGGFHYYGYYPGFWFHPGFYGWAFAPWAAPVYWGWGWGGAPWFGFYAGFFAPYPVYPSPAFWLTDYLIAENLQAAYAAQAAAGGYDQGAANYAPNSGDAGQAANSAQVALSPEVKQAIAEEVKAQLAEQQQQAATQGLGDGQATAPASGDVPPALNPARRTFVVDTELTVVSDGQECELTGGDVLTRLTDTPDAHQNVTASVAASKKNDCAAGKQVAVSVDALQEMHNHFEEQLNNGLKTLAEKQGTGGMPKSPDASTVASDMPAPQPDQDAAKALADQQAQADQTESQVKQEAAGGGGL